MNRFRKIFGSRRKANRKLTQLRGLAEERKYLLPSKGDWNVPSDTGPASRTSEPLIDGAISSRVCLVCCIPHLEAS